MAGYVARMLREALDESREKLASDRAAMLKTPDQNTGHAKTASAEQADNSGENWEKVASACDFLADKLHEVVDTRSPREKLAELKVLAEKVGASMADEPQGPHQRTKSPDAPSMTPPADDGVGPGAPGTAAASEPATTAGESLDANSSGSASDQPPMNPSDSEAAREGDTPTSLETNNHTPPGAGDMAPEKIAAAKIKLIEKMASEGRIDASTAVSMAKEAFLTEGLSGYYGSQEGGGVGGGLAGAGKTFGKGLLGGVGGAGLGALGGAGLSALSRGKIPMAAGAGTGANIGGNLGAIAGGVKGVADERSAMLERRKKNQASKTEEPAEKQAQDPSSPQPSIGSAKSPELQSVTEPQLSQGSEAGEATPAGPADEKRRHVQSVEAAINATKGDLKHQQVKSEMSRYLDQPAMSSANDSVLQTQLDNTSSAGVKIAAVRALLEKWANEDPQNKDRLSNIVSRVKQANEMMGYPAGDAGAGAAAPVPGMTNAGGMSAPMPGEGMPNKMAEGEDPASDAALTAAAAGVTPEELEQALMLLSASAEEAEVEDDPQDVPPVAEGQAEPAVG